MKNNDYIDEVLNDEWKPIDGNDEVTILGWVDSKFVVEVGLNIDSYDYDEFFMNFVNKNNERIWSNGEGGDQMKKYVSGWLCILNGMSLFNIASKETQTETNKEFYCLSAYIKDRVEDAQFSIQNNLQLPWMEEKVVYGSKLVSNY